MYLYLLNMYSIWMNATFSGIVYIIDPKKSELGQGKPSQFFFIFSDSILLVTIMCIKTYPLNNSYEAKLSTEIFGIHFLSFLRYEWKM